MKTQIKYYASALLFVAFLNIQNVNAQVEKQREKPTPEQVISMFDTNKDGKIDIEEARTAESGKLYKKFGFLDTDKNGLVTLEELQNRRAHADKNGRMERGNRKGDRSRPTPEQIMEKLDTDEDGSINKEEASQAPRGRLSEKFDKVDTNVDELISIEELQKHIDSRKEK
ncbi:MAG: EF-hand domain-containing protein [Reichenbachiella sp.]